MTTGSSLHTGYNGLVVECLTQDRLASPASLRCVLEQDLVLVQPRKTCPFIAENLLMGPKESNQTNKLANIISLMLSYKGCLVRGKIGCIGCHTHGCQVMPL